MMDMSVPLGKLCWFSGSKRASKASRTSHTVLRELQSGAMDETKYEESLRALKFQLTALNAMLPSLKGRTD